MFCKSFDHASNRGSFRRDPQAFLERFPITLRQKEVVLNLQWLELLRLGGNIYHTFKPAIFDGLTMQHVGAATSDSGMTVDEFRDVISTSR